MNMCIKNLTVTGSDKVSKEYGLNLKYQRSIY